MSDLAEFLGWPEDGELAACFEARFRATAERRLSAALSEAHGYSMEVAGSLVRTASALPAESLMRLAYAPELEFRVRAVALAENGHAALTAFLCEALQAELLLLEPQVGTPGEEGVWTGLGDFHLVGDPLRREEAPRLGESVRIDFDSPHNRGDIANRFPAFGLPAGEGRSAVVKALQDAFGLVERSSVPARRFTEAFTSMVVCIGIPGTQYGSFSSRWYPGRSVLINVDQMGREELAAALVHEAIHSLIDASELGGNLLRRPAPPGATARSPWSGAALALSSLLEAYFVWYGLLWFWQRAGERGTVGARTADARIEEACRGFGPEFEAVVGEYLPSVHEDVVSVIEELRLLAQQGGATRPLRSARTDR